MSAYRPGGGGTPPPRTKAGVRLAEVDEIELTIEKIVAGGDGFGRFEGIPIFVPRSVPGDVLRGLIVERRPDYGRAEILEILEPGEGRREPPCPHFGRCGGCDLQQVDDDLQVDLKVAAVRETLERLAGLTLAETEVIRGPAWGYRLRTQIHTAPIGGRVAIGYHARNSRELVEVDSCPVLVPVLERQLSQLPGLLPEAPPTRIDLTAGDDDSVTSAPWIDGLPHGEVSVRVGEFDYSLDARCFFQGHRFMLDELVASVIGNWEGDRAWDLFAGVGLFSLPLARRYREVVAVEGDRIAARLARRNAQRNRLRNVQVVTAAVDSWIRKGGSSIDRIVVDPPRSGLSSTLRSMLENHPPRRLTYASCHPAAMARDLKALCRAFDLERVTMLDLFPQTGHIEVIAQLRASR